jgi:hypothetical protein
VKDRWREIGSKAKHMEGEALMPQQKAKKAKKAQGV